MNPPSLTVIAVTCLLSASVPSILAAQVPDAIAASGEAVMLTVHAEGAQIYECKADSGGKLVWQFREPIAALIADGKTVGRHYAGELGSGRRQRGDRQGGRSRSRCDGERHPVAQTRGHVAAWDGPTHRRHDDPENQHQRWHGRRSV